MTERSGLRPGIVIETDNPLTICLTGRIIHATRKPTRATEIDSLIQNAEAWVCLTRQPASGTIGTGIVDNNHRRKILRKCMLYNRFEHR
ncbi:hypothetical protein AA105894_2092 [Asaia spathodeae NBRC 105894]|nr:hypothetical protein AA105894_2092 [Asaia spathodeae NBRC 105894]